jgi:predicted RNA-binding Zn ribbon-like protein
MLKNALDDPQQMVDPDEDVSAYSPEDLARMVDRMQQMAQSGARDAARDMLADLREMMENLQAGRIAPPGQQGAGGRMMQELRALSDEQQRLMDQTFRRAQGMGDGDAATSEALSQMQRMLRDRLGQLMERMGELGADLPDALGAAELRMRAAEEALRQGTNRSAVNAQTQALQGLREGAQRLMQQLSEQQGEGEGQNQSGNGDGGRQQARDPLGRAIPGTGSDDGSDVAVPTESEMQRARRILDELRRRSAEPRRPPVERDYIERLLRRF